MLSQEEYVALVEQSPILIWRARPDKLCDYFNERWLSFTGRTMAQEFGNGWAEGVHPEDLDRCFSIYVQSFDSRTVFEMEYRLMRADGQYRWLLDRGVPYYHHDGSFAGYIGSCTDVTARVEAEGALEASRECEILKLKRLLPICAWCKRVRSDDGYWKQIHEYLGEEGLGTATHGICEICSSLMDDDSGCKSSHERDSRA